MLLLPLGSFTRAILSAQKDSPTGLHLKRGLDNSCSSLKLYFETSVFHTETSSSPL